MKKIILIAAIISSFTSVFAQQSSPIVKLSLKDKKDKLVEIRAYGAIYVEGYDGDSLIIVPYNPADHPRILDEPFIKDNVKWIDNIKLRGSHGKLGDDGLKDVTALFDHPAPVFRPGTLTPLISDLAQETRIDWFPDNAYKSMLVKIPRNTHLRLLFSSLLATIDEVSIKNLTGELEITGIASSIDVDNISGPLTLSSPAPGWGESTFSAKVNISHIKLGNVSLTDKKFLLYLSANTADMDISLPADLKATVNIQANYGDIYSDLDLVKKQPQSNELNNFSGDLNGGGIPITIITNYGNVFLRKQK